jgi:hypothetical protein
MHRYDRYIEESQTKKTPKKNTAKLPLQKLPSANVHYDTSSKCSDHLFVFSMLRSMLLLLLFLLLT